LTLELDAADPLAPVRERFDLDDGVTYLDGNSLGALPRSVPARLDQVIRQEWGRLRIRSWEESGWWDAPTRVGDLLAPLLGAAPGQVLVGDSTSVALFKGLIGAARLADRPDGELLVDGSTFPTDGYIAESAARLTGLRLRPVDPARLPEEISERTAVVLLNHVDYRTGELRDLPGAVAAARRSGAVLLVDLCHSAGALPVELDASGVQLAVGCTYKYLNGGPGSPAFLYLRSDLQERFDQPIPGWTGHADPFAMEAGYRPGAGISRARSGTVEILSMLALETALDAWRDVDLAEVRTKSLALTDHFLHCVNTLVPEGRCRSVTPSEHRRRGSQIALACENAGNVMEKLIARQVVGDHRPPDLLRFGFTPLYTRYADALHAAEVLAEILT
jgi:kynureninase